jgi:hypothetical protein
LGQKPVTPQKVAGFLFAEGMAQNQSAIKHLSRSTFSVLSTNNLEIIHILHG